MKKPLKQQYQHHCSLQEIRIFCNALFHLFIAQKLLFFNPLGIIRIFGSKAGLFFLKGKYPEIYPFCFQMIPQNATYT